MKKSKRVSDVSTIVSGSAEAVSPKAVVASYVVDNIVLQYYTIIYCPENMGGCWYGTGILESSAEEAMRKFSTYTGVGKFNIVRIDLKTNAG